MDFQTRQKKPSIYESTANYNVLFLGQSVLSICPKVFMNEVLNSSFSVINIPNNI